jgi:hydrogenase-4 component F
MLIAIMIFTPVIFSLLIIAFRSRYLNYAAGILNALIFIAAAVMMYFDRGSFTVFFKVDDLNIIFIFILAVINLGISFYTISYLKHSGNTAVQETLYMIFYMLCIACMAGVILSTHIGLLWVFVEATTLTTAYLIYFNRTKESLEASWKYIFICSIGIALAFVGIILLSIGKKEVSSLFFENLYADAKNANGFWMKLAFVFILFGFGTKMGLAPMHSWLPDAHSEAPSPISAMLSGALLNAALLGILRVLKIVELSGHGGFARTLLLIMGFLSLIISATFILRTNNYKRMLAYSSIENMGIIAIAVGLGGGAIWAAILHTISHSFAKSSLFLTAGNILKHYGTKKINEVSGLINIDKRSGWLWILSFAAIAGIPPSSIFISEFLIAKEFASGGNFVLMGIFLAVLAVILFGMGRSVINMTFGRPAAGVKGKTSLFSFLPQILFLIIILILGIYMPGPVSKMIEDAAKLF